MLDFPTLKICKMLYLLKPNMAWCLRKNDWYFMRNPLGKKQKKEYIDVGF